MADKEDPKLTPSTNDTTDVRDPSKPPVIQPAKPMSEKDRPTKYTHLVCDTEMRLDEERAAEYHSNPDAFPSLPCTHCGGNYRIGPDGEMVWSGSKDKVQGGLV